MGDIADHLISSMADAGIPREQAQSWVLSHLSVTQVKVEYVMTGDREQLPIGP